MTLEGNRQSPPKVGVMMPAYNAEKYIGRAIESLLAQSFTDWELVIVNDGSTDATAQVIARYIDPRIRVYAQPNAGESSARNLALKHLRSEYLAFLDADDLYLPNHLEVTVAYLETHPADHGVYTDGYYIDAQDNRLATLSSRRRGPFEGDIFEEMVRASDVFGAPLCVVLRRSIVVNRELDFDTDIVIGPDWDFLTRYAETARFGYLPQPTCLYRLHQTNISRLASSSRRLSSLARCREKAIQLPRFHECSLETRAFVFYDLLINLLADDPERQAIVVQYPEFNQLPSQERARLYRLMAVEAMKRGVEASYSAEWLRLARRIHPADWRSAALYLIFKLNPSLCRSLIRLRALYRAGSRDLPSPFSQLAGPLGR